MASNLTTTALVKQHLDITSSNKDTVIGTIVDGVNAGLENMLGTTFAETTYTDEEYDMAHHSRTLILQNRPVTTFTRLQYKDSPNDFDDDNWTSFDSDEYVVDFESGIVTKNTNFVKGKRRYRATYKAGYATIPDDLKMAATKIAASLVTNRSSGNIDSESLGQYSRTFSNDPSSWKRLGVEFTLQKYRRQNMRWFFRPIDVERNEQGVNRLKDHGASLAG